MVMNLPPTFQFFVLDSRGEGAGRGCRLNRDFQFFVLDSLLYLFFSSSADLSFNSLYWIRGLRSQCGGYPYTTAFNSLYWIPSIADSARLAAKSVAFNSLYWIRMSRMRWRKRTAISPLSILCIGFSRPHTWMTSYTAMLRLSILCIGFS